MKMAKFGSFVLVSCFIDSNDNQLGLRLEHKVMTVLSPLDFPNLKKIVITLQA